MQTANTLCLSTFKLLQTVPNETVSMRTSEERWWALCWCLLSVMQRCLSSVTADILNGCASMWCDGDKLSWVVMSVKGIIKTYAAKH